MPRFSVPRARLTLLAAFVAAALPGCKSGVSVTCGEAVPEREIVLMVSSQAATAAHELSLANLVEAAADSAAVVVDVTTQNAHGRCTASQGGARVDLTAADLSHVQVRISAAAPVTIRAVGPDGRELARGSFDPASATHPPLTWS
jgi:hypothetical protein